MAAKFAAGPTFGYAATKRAIHASNMNDFETHLELEADYMKACGESRDYAEGVGAFLDKRTPEFSGK